MKYNILICDDEQTQIEIIKSYINKLRDEIKFHGDIFTANCAEELLNNLNNKDTQLFKEQDIPIFFLDVEMDEMNGLELGKKLRKIYKQAVIVYVTGFMDYAIDAFEIRAFHYIIKPIGYDKFRELFLEIIEKVKELTYKKENEEIFVLETKESINKIPYKDIYYFEKSLHKIKAFCSEGSYEFYGSFKNLMHSLDMMYFTQCHQGYIINNRRISSYKDQRVYLKEMDRYIPVSKSCIKIVKDVLTKQLFD